MSEPLSLKEIQLKLAVPAHVLIHLCEKEVVVPDIFDARGRGSVRLFSERNVFEFQVALTLRRYQIPVKVIRVVTQLLREMDGEIRREGQGAGLPSLLLERHSPEVVLHFVDGRTLLLLLKGARSKTCLSVDVRPLLAGKQKGQASIKHVEGLPADYETCLTINLSVLAKSFAASEKKFFGPRKKR